MPRGVYTRTMEHGLNISKAKKGCKQPPQCKVFQKGHIDLVNAESRKQAALKITGSGNPAYGTKWMYNNTIHQTKRVNKDQVPYYLDNGWVVGLSQEHIRNRDASFHKNSDIRSPKILSNDHKHKLRIAKIGKFGKECNHYKDGRTPLLHSIYSLDEYKVWRTAIFRRDGYKCQDCGTVGGRLEAHHIKRFTVLLTKFLQKYSQFSPIEDKETLTRLAITYKPFWKIRNGKTLCKKCHGKTWRKIKPNN